MELRNVLVVDPVDGEYVANVRVSGRKIESVEMSQGSPSGLLIPGFVDVHTHGAAGVKVRAWKRILRSGRGSCMHRVYFSSLPRRFAELRMLKYRNCKRNILRQIHILGKGIHMKGLHKFQKKGARNPETIRLRILMAA